MSRTLLAVLVCAGLSSTSLLAGGPQDLDALMRRYDAAAVAEGHIQVTVAGDLTYVSGTSPDGPWVEVWRRGENGWTMVAELVRAELSPIRFGAKRDRSCRRTS